MMVGPVDAQQVKLALADSGARRDFGTGAVRDTDSLVNGMVKGRMDLFPVSLICDLLEDSLDEKTDGLLLRSVCDINDYLVFDDSNYLLSVFKNFSEYRYGDVYQGIIATSRQFQLGAKKYSSFNWARGIPAHCYLDSALRHLMKFLSNSPDDEEDQEIHSQAFLWNVICLYWTINYSENEELNDIVSEFNFKE